MTDVFKIIVKYRRKIIAKYRYLSPSVNRVLLAYTHLHLLIHTYVLFILLCELDKIVKIWGICKLR